MGAASIMGYDAPWRRRVKLHSMPRTPLYSAVLIDAIGNATSPGQQEVDRLAETLCDEAFSIEHSGCPKGNRGTCRRRMQAVRAARIALGGVEVS
jgi:hypothetical protein